MRVKREKEKSVKSPVSMSVIQSMVTENRNERDLEMKKDLTAVEDVADQTETKAVHATKILEMITTNADAVVQEVDLVTTSM